MSDSAFLLGIVAQTLAMGLVVFRAAKWAGSVDSAFASLTKTLDEFREDTATRFESLEERLTYLERREQR